MQVSPKAALSPPGLGLQRAASAGSLVGSRSSVMTPERRAEELRQRWGWCTRPGFTLDMPMPASPQQSPASCRVSPPMTPMQGVYSEGKPQRAIKFSEKTVWPFTSPVGMKDRWLQTSKFRAATAPIRR
eukprot:TRINITY_DN16417_c0_g1_i1.p1 TRINITY_DN16417_c0_g1~~TRINITY_DN16417_c0_g1_i1.p1  ORF type:complete len:129 (-),score=17.29 TRINITY_DN16417_c0_g1_i1:365-751(-)